MLEMHAQEKCEMRFNSALVVGMRGSGLKTLLEGVAYPVFGTQSQGHTALLQGGTATPERLTRLLSKARGESEQIHLASHLLDGKTVVMTALRHPVDRIVNRYWFEGRYPQHSKARQNESAAVSIEEWIRDVRKQNQQDNPRRGGYVWQCVDNYYTAVLSGSMLGKPVDEGDFKKAKAALAGELISPGFAFALELLSSSPTESLVRKSLCASNTTQPRVTLAVKRAAGGQRVPRGFKLQARLYADLLAANSFDLRLWTFVTEEHKRRIAAA